MKTTWQVATAKEGVEARTDSIRNSICHPSRSLTVGLLINPYAGAGGPIALKGSDVLPDVIRRQVSEQIQHGQAPAQLRVLAMLEALKERLLADTHLPALCIRSIHGAMGAAVVLAAHLPVERVRLELVSVDAYRLSNSLKATSLPPTQMPIHTTASDTQQAVRALQQSGIDLLIFAGGDGTARDICSVIDASLPVLGIPAGVKMHSGVFAVNPQSASALLVDILAGFWVGLDVAEVRDLDEAEVRAGRVRSCYYGALKVPVEARYVQQVKCSGPELETLVQDEIAAGVIERLQPGHCYAFGAGTTLAAIMNKLNLPNTLLGFDVVRDGALILADATAEDLLGLAAGQALTVFITATGGQGSLLGRGNQQLSAKLLQHIGREHVSVLATPAKLERLAGRPLRLDTGNAALDDAWSGLWTVITGYEQSVLYRVSA